jgi:hypothetical protein
MTGSHRRWLVNSALLLTGIASMFTGFLIQTHYHMGRSTGAVWGCGHAAWAIVHQLASFAFLAAVAWHLSLNWKPLISLCTRRGAWRSLGFFVTMFFLLAAVTALAAWVAFMFLGQRSVEKVLVEIHDKVTIPLSVLLLLHVVKRRARLFRRATK